ncbi:MAG TPA: hypothetical protein VIG51_09360 [Candidatus Baltobacteraceae bacterium]|jgi:hypothetical protein
MKRTIGAIAVCLCIAPTAAVAALPPAPIPAASPSPAVAEFADPAMAFKAAPGFLKIYVPPHDPANFEQPTVVAGFVKNPGKDDQLLLTISMQNWDGFNLDGFEGTNENEMRGQVQSLFVSRKERAQLANGMPAYWMVILVGSGFSSQKWYEYVWLDGMRAVTVAIKSRLGAVSEKDARDDLAGLTAVAYPRNRQ